MIYSVKSDVKYENIMFSIPVPEVPEFPEIKIDWGKPIEIPPFVCVTVIISPVTMSGEAVIERNP